MTTLFIIITVISFPCADAVWLCCSSKKLFLHQSAGETQNENKIQHTALWKKTGTKFTAQIQLYKRQIKKIHKTWTASKSGLQYWHCLSNNSWYNMSCFISRSLNHFFSVTRINDRCHRKRGKHSFQYARRRKFVAPLNLRDDKNG